jgi:hypothetical protein
MEQGRSRHPSKTHFEQIPLEIMRTIAELQTDTVATSKGFAIVNRPVPENEMTDQENSQDLECPVWQKLCREALIELDPDKLKERVAAAEAAVFMRSQELAHSSDAQAERQALRDATSSLRFLKRDVLKFPDWEPEEKS